MIFLILLQYIKPHFAIDQYYPSHQDFIDRYVDSGHFICSGRKTLKTGEFILCKAGNRKEAQAIVAEDPFDINQLAVFEIVQYSVTAYAKAFGSLVDAEA
ncbi:MAG TPA: YciI family protein [Chitinophagaceae bacterium]|jgi:uncharacterized protein YciI|nr:YciI family protein [Chitinophagaceae bacterium]